RVLAVTDAALSSLDADALYRELLGRTRSLLGTDTAAIMLLDPDAEQLQTVAAIRLEAAGEQGIRGDGGARFAGRRGGGVGARGRAAVIAERVDPSTVASPILRQTGITTLIGVPMLSGGDLVGVLTLGSYEQRQFSEQDVSLLQMVAERAAQAARSAQAS